MATPETSSGTRWRPNSRVSASISHARNRGHARVQLVQPFISLLFALPLLGETLDSLTIGFGLAVIATVFIGKRMPVH